MTGDAQNDVIEIPSGDFPARYKANPKGEAQVAKSVPALQLGLFSEVYKGKASPRLAIKAKCIECCGCDGGYMERIGGCTAYRCPLWGYRPYQDRASE